MEFNSVYVSRMSLDSQVATYFTRAIEFSVSVDHHLCGSEIKIGCVTEGVIPGWFKCWLFHNKKSFSEINTRNYFVKYTHLNLSTEDLIKLLKSTGLDSLLQRFDKGLETKVSSSSSLSLGQKQIIAFMRAVLRKPKLLILDEATANIDTVTEVILEDILKKLPTETTRVVIAHRLNTIENADDIFFVNGGEVKEAGSMEHAVEMLLHHKRKS